MLIKIKSLLLILLTFGYLIITPTTFAQMPSCDNRYATIINPIRSRQLWQDQSLKPFEDQYTAVTNLNLKATWLIQDDVLKDQLLLDKVKNMNSSQEIGVFMEVSENSAKESRVLYPGHTYWYNPKAVFLSGYTPSERIKIIDKTFSNFKDIFGYYPKSVGAWWIDSYSLGYMNDKYQISSVMLVADQLSTDGYGVWGQWWGVAYYPNKINILEPALTIQDKEDVVILQWAQRDLSSSYGDTPTYSNYSLQANDYIRQGKNTEYFGQLINSYLDCQNPIGQVTVGLETGIESVGYIDEYRNQMDYIKNHPEIKAVTMNEFSEAFKAVYPNIVEKISIKDYKSEWVLSNVKRENRFLNDTVIYQNNLAFADYFTADQTDFLNRRLPDLYSQATVTNYYPWFLLLMIVSGAISLIKNKLRLWAVGTLLSISAFGLILRSFEKYGWKVFYGPEVGNILCLQIAVFIGSLLVVYGLSRIFLRYKISEKLLWIFPLTFGLGSVFYYIRYTILDGKYYFGIMVDALRFVGISFEKPFNIAFQSFDFQPTLAIAVLKLDILKFWTNPIFYFVINPVLHLLLALAMILLIKKFPRLLKPIFIILIIGLILHLFYIFNLNPQSVTPNKN